MGWSTLIGRAAIYRTASRSGQNNTHVTASIGWGWLLMAGLCGACLPQLSAQEALRASLAGSDAAEVRKRAVTTVGYHNLKAGPVMFRFTTGLGTEYNSNVNYQNENPEGDVIFRPSVGTGIFWPVSDKNMLFVNANFGYSAYVNNSQLSRLYVSPGTEISFDIYLRDLVINFHDRPYLSQYAYQDPTVSGTGDFAQFQNTIGGSGLWDLQDVIVSFGYDHNNYWGLTSSSQQRDGSTDLFYLSSGLRVKPELTVGLDLGAGFFDYTAATYPDAFQASFGGFARYILSDLMNVRLNAGYVIYSPDNTGIFSGLEDSDLLYLQLAVQHRVNHYLNYVLSGSRGFQISFYGGSYETYDVSLGLSWNVLKRISLSTPFSFRHSEPVIASEAPFNYYGGGIRLGREITGKLDGGLTFSVYVKDSEIETFSYTVFLAGLDLRYRF